MKRWQIALLIGLVVVIISGAGYLGVLVALPQQEAVAADASVTVAVTMGDVKQTVTAPGELSWTWPVILSMGTGGQVAEIYARPGAWPQPGPTVAGKA